MKKTILLILVIISCFSIVNSTPISSCQTINTSGNYTLTGDILNNASNPCIEFAANNIQFDCQGYTIDGMDTSSTAGILNNGFDNFEINNCIITDYYYGLDFDSVNGGVVNNTNISSNYMGINGRFVDNIIFNNLNVEDNTGRGVYLVLYSNNNQFSNSIFQRNLDYPAFYLDSGSGSNSLTNVSIIDNGNGGGFDQGLFIQSDNNVFTNIIATNNTNLDIELWGTNNTIDFINFSHGDYASTGPQNLLSYDANIHSCSALDWYNVTYSLTQDITNTNTDPCMSNTVADHVTLNCQGYTIDGTDASNTEGILFDTVDYFNVSNCEITDFSNGIYFDSARYGSISNVNISSITSYGLNINRYTDYNNFTNVRVTNNGGRGIYMNLYSNFNTFDNVLIQNNLDTGLTLSSGTDNNYIYNSIIINNGNGGNFDYGVEVLSQNNIFTNNTIVNNSPNDIYMRNSAGTNTIDFINFSQGNYISQISQNLLSYDANINSCGTLAWVGINFTLTQDIINTATSPCFDNQWASNIALNCQGYTVDGNDAATYGFEFDDVDYFTIENCIISDFTYAFHFDNTDYNVFNNITMSSNSYYGFFGSYVDFNNFTNIIVENNGRQGIYFSTSSDRNKIINSSIRNNVDDGIFLVGTSDYNDFNNLNITNNGGSGSEAGIRFTSTNNQIINSYFFGNSPFEIIVGGSDNLLYGNYFSNSSLISGTLTGVDWNTSSPDIGNFYGDFNSCITNESRFYNGYTYYICTSPSNFNIGGSGTFDYAPLASSTFVLGNISSPPPGNSSNSTSTTVSSSSVPFGSLTSLIITIGTLSLFFLFN